KSDTTTLLRTAAVVRNRGHVGDRRDADAQRSQRAHGGFTTRAGTLDFHVQVLDALFDRGAASHFGRHLCGKRRGLARTLETLTAGRSPRKSIALAISDRDDGVVEGSVNVGNAVADVLADLLAHTLRGGIRGFCHDLPSLLLQRCSALARTLAGACVGTGALTAHRQAAAVMHAAVAADVDPPLDVHRGLAAQVAFDRVLGDLVADFFLVAIGQILDLLRERDPAGHADLACARATDAVNGGQTDFSVLMRRDV